MGTYPCFYYSTYQGFTNLTVDNSQTDLTDTALWSQTAPEDLADVTAIAIDLRHKADGSAYTFAPEEVALCYVTMTAPANYWDYIDDPATAGDETARAYNSAYLQCTTTPVYGGTGSTAVAILCHILCALWPNLLTIFCPDSTLAATGVCTALILIGIVSFSVLCTRDYNAFILSGQSLDYARLSGQKAPTKSRLTFKGKLTAAMTSAFFSASAALWLIRIVRGLTILS